MAPWHSYLRLTERMLELAEHQRWLELERAHRERRALEKKLQTAELEGIELNRLVPCLERCLALNDRIVSLAASAKQQTASRMKRAQLASHAVAAYRSAQGLAGPTKTNEL